MSQHLTIPSISDSEVHYLHLLKVCAVCFCEDDVQDSGEPCVVEWLQCEVCDAWMHCSCTGIEVNDMCYMYVILIFL